MKYLLGIGIIFIVWISFFLLRKDLRKPMIWSGWYYFCLLSVGFVCIRVLGSDLPSGRMIVPGYWNPDTLFNLAEITGGYSIEDALYMFFSGGIAVAAYELLFRKHINHHGLKHRPHIATVIAGIIGIIVAIFTTANLIWVLITFGFVGALVIWFQRPDLIRHSFMGGVIYLGIYFIFFSIFLMIFPNFISMHYGLENLTGYMIVGIPIEELVFAFSFGLMWSPIYEYIRDIK
jgi:hypothetical protein